jgi:hypothetical protein
MEMLSGTLKLEQSFFFIDVPHQRPHQRLALQPKPG